MLLLKFSEGQLLHDLGIERAANPMPVEDAHQLSHRAKLKLARIARAVAPQFPVINKCQIDCWRQLHPPMRTKRNFTFLCRCCRHPRRGESSRRAFVRPGHALDAAIVGSVFPNSANAAHVQIKSNANLRRAPSSSLEAIGTMQKYAVRGSAVRSFQQTDTDSCLAP